MPPKKGKKISLNEFLGDSSLGSWADEMDSLPNAPAVRAEGDDGRDRFRRDDFLSSKPDRQAGPPREDLPLPTAPPYTSFVGNLAFDISEDEMIEYFGPRVKSVKIIKDRDDRPKGFGYIEYEDLDALKNALTKTGSTLSGRTIRVSVAEPPKERSGFGGGPDESKFDDPWRRGGPLPDLPSRDSSRRRFDGPRNDDRAGVSDGPTDWRASGRGPPRGGFDSEGPSPPASIRRKGPGFAQDSAADSAESWTMGSKFKPTPAEEERNGRDSKFGSLRGRGDMGPPRDSIPEEPSDWRSAPRRPAHSPNNSTPPTPQLGGRRKLELLPRSGSVSGTTSPLASPKLGPTPTSSSSNAARSNPFGAARPVDVTSREKEVEERLEKDREMNKERLTMSRTSSRTGTDRPIMRRAESTTSSVPPTPSSPRHSFSAPTQPKAPASNPSVRANFSFANAAAKKDLASAESSKNASSTTVSEEDKTDSVDEIAEKVAEVDV